MSLLHFFSFSSAIQLFYSVRNMFELAFFFACVQHLIFYWVQITGQNVMRIIFSTACMWSHVDFWSKSHEILFLSIYSGGEYSKWDYITSAHWKEEVEIFNKSLIDRFENDVDLSFLMMIFTVNFGSWLHKATDVSMMWSSFRILGDKI